MKAILAIIAVSALTACTAVTPVKRNFPAVPASINKPCEELKAVEKTDKLSEVLVTVTDNYSRSLECQIKVDSWIEWYTQQKKVFESVK
jgi:hypothetical protein